MGAINTDRLKNVAAADAILRFQRWVPELIQKYRKKEIVQVSKEPDFDLVLKKLKFVRSVHDETGWDLTDMQKRVLEDAGFYSITHAADLPKPMPIAPPKPKDYLTATDIGDRIGKTAHEVNMFLYQRNPPLVIKDHAGEWRLTEHGHEYAEERIREVSLGAFVWRIKWKKDVLRLFNVFDHQEMG